MVLSQPGLPVVLSAKAGLHKSRVKKFIYLSAFLVNICCEKETKIYQRKTRY